MKQIITYFLLVAFIASAANTHPPVPFPSSGGIPNTFFKPNAPIGPSTYTASYPSHWDVLGGGGFRAFYTSNDMLSTPLLWRVTGMGGIVSNDMVGFGPSLYVLQPDLTTWTPYALSQTNGGVPANMVITNQYGASNYLRAVVSPSVFSLTNEITGDVTEVYWRAGTYTWTNPPGALYVTVDVIAAGGSGGGGGLFSDPIPSYGGGGGGSGGWSHIELMSYEIETNVIVFVGSMGGTTSGPFNQVLGGVGGSGISGNVNRRGNPGSNGHPSYFGNYIYATGGGQGLGGSSNGYNDINMVFTGSNYLGGEPGWGDFHMGSWGGDGFGTNYTNYSLYAPGGGGAGGTKLGTTPAWGDTNTFGRVGGSGPTRQPIPVPGGKGGTNATTLYDGTQPGVGTNSFPPSRPFNSFDFFGPPPNTALGMGSGGGGSVGAYIGFPNDLTTVVVNAGRGSFPGGGGGGGGGGSINASASGGGGGEAVVVVRTSFGRRKHIPASGVWPGE